MASFHDEHERLYGYCYRDRLEVVVEWVNLRVTSFGPIERPNPRQIKAGTGAVETQHRDVYFGEWSEVPVYDRSQLGQGDSIQGPAVIEEFGSTTPIAPNFGAVVDELGNLIIRPNKFEGGS